MNSAARELVSIAEQLGFTYDAVTGSGHITLRHPNGTVTIPSTPGEYRGRKNAISQMEQVAGQRLPRTNTGRSRKPGQVSGFSVDRAARESAAWHRKNDEEIAKLRSKRLALIKKCREFATDRGALREIPRLLKRIAETEERLRGMGQHVDPFDPLSLADL